MSGMGSSQKGRHSLAWRGRWAKMAAKRKTGSKARKHKRAKSGAPAAKKPARRKAKPAALSHPRKRPRARSLPPRRLKLGASPYDTGLDPNPANFQPLTPLSHLARAA